MPIAPEEYLLEMGLRMVDASEERGELTGIRLITRGSRSYGCPGAAPGTD